MLDLGSGAGKICFVASQIVGPTGRVIGVDVNDAMLALARDAAPIVARRVGFGNVEFRRGRIQDLALDLDALEPWLREHPVRGVEDVAALDAECDRLRRVAPLVPDASVDVLVSNCVLNLVREADKGQLVREIARVLKPGGRIAISDIVGDEPVPEQLKADPTLWSGCVSGAFTEQGLLAALEEAGFFGIALAHWERRPFAIVEGIEFRSVTVTAVKGVKGPCWEANRAVIYRGPWKRVEDDDGHVLRRGERTAVCAKTYATLTSAPYASETIAVAPRVEIPEAERRPFDCSRVAARHPRESKGADFAETSAPTGPAACSPGGSCC
ncbi:MAG: methyltransferase domain-containing protein [Thermodesulfobacteriota bacterium]